jgi:hypothetical protein
MELQIVLGGAVPQATATRQLAQRHRAIDQLTPVAAFVDFLYR